jgi:tRNA threonylcarbamoyladenosine biosynthesis protein TsaB
MRLVIETAGLACSVALFDGDRLVAAIHEEVMRGHAERLLPMIAELPNGGQADAILVDCGPGSFTGVRVGLAAAQGLGIGWQIPVCGYSSLALLAACHFKDSNGVTATIAIPGGHGEVFAQGFTRFPFVETSPLRSQRQEFEAADNLVHLERPVLDARRTPLLPAAFCSMRPVPIYGRGADAKPMQ